MVISDDSLRINTGIQTNRNKSFEFITQVGKNCKYFISNILNYLMISGEKPNF